MTTVAPRSTMVSRPARARRRSRRQVGAASSMRGVRENDSRESTTSRRRAISPTPAAAAATRAGWPVLEDSSTPCPGVEGVLDLVRDRRRVLPMAANRSASTSASCVAPASACGRARGAPTARTSRARRRAGGSKFSCARRRRPAREPPRRAPGTAGDRRHALAAARCAGALASACSGRVRYADSIKAAITPARTRTPARPQRPHLLAQFR